MHYDIDECHLVRQWSNLRSSFATIGAMWKYIKEVPHIALTATATNDTRTKVMNSLKMEKPIVFSKSVARTDIQINVTPKKTDKLATQIYAVITKNFQFKPGLI